MSISRFPSNGYPDDILYEDLDPINREIVTKHLKISGEIKMWDNIKSWLIDQIHHKKSVIIKGKYIPTDKITSHYYNKKQLTSFDKFPSAFQCYLEELLVDELKTTNFNFIAVYYGHDSKPDELKYSDFDKNEWILSEGLQMTLDDVTIMEKYKRNFINFVDSCVNMLKCYEKSKNYKYKYTIVNKERNRIVKAINS